MRILHTSDWHLGKSLYDFLLIDDQQYMLERLLDLLAARRIDVLVLAGDIYDRPVPSAQAIQLYDYFLSQAVGRLGIPVVAIAGNHDSASRLEFGSGFYAAGGYHICGQPRVDIHRITLSDAHGPVDFWLLPWLHPAEIRALLPDEQVRTFDDAYRALLRRNLVDRDPARRAVAVAHGYFRPIGGHADKELITSDSEVNIGGTDIVDTSYFSAFQYVALGHLHAPQRSGGETIRYCGSPLKYSLSEERQNKCFLLVELGAGGVEEITPLSVPALRDLRTVYGSLDELLEPSVHTNTHFNDYVFAELSDADALYPMEKLRRLFPHLLGLRLNGAGDGMMPEIHLGEAMPRLSPVEMFARFYHEIKGCDMPLEAAALLRETMEHDRGVAQ